jgi:hypothetical protein
LRAEFGAAVDGCRSKPSCFRPLERKEIDLNRPPRGWQGLDGIEAAAAAAA